MFTAYNFLCTFVFLALATGNLCDTLFPNDLDPSLAPATKQINCDPPTRCEKRGQRFPTMDPKKFYVCQIPPTPKEKTCPLDYLFNAETLICVRPKDWKDHCDRTPQTTTTEAPTTTTTTPTTTPTMTTPTTPATTTHAPYSGKVCPGVLDPSKVKPGTNACDKPSCFWSIGHKFPAKDPQSYYSCRFFFWPTLKNCPNGECFLRSTQGCVKPTDWINSCA